MKENYLKATKLFVLSFVILLFASLTFTIIPILVSIILTTIFVAFTAYFMSFIVQIAWHAKPYQGEYRKKLLAFAKINGIVLRQIYVSPSNHSNAHAMGCLNNKSVLYNSITLEKHPEDEIIGVMAHEVGHLKNNDAFVTVPIITFIVVMLCLFNRWFITQHSITVFLSIALIETIIFLPIILAVNRWREHLADKTAKEILPDPASFARFLQRMRHLYELEGTKFPMKLSFIQKLLITHPPFYERIIFLERK